MGKIEKYKELLENYIGKEKIVKLSKDKYFINTNLVLFNTSDLLPVYLVQIGEKIFFADFGYCFANLKTDNLKNVIEKITSALEKSNLIIDEDSLVMNTTLETLYKDFNFFVATIMCIQMLSMED